MKPSKLVLTTLLALGAAVGVQAQTTVLHITGSTAFRAAVHQAILNILAPGSTYAYSGASIGSANQAIFTGTTITNSIPVVIKTSWSGSVGGVQTVSEQFPISTWLTNTTPQSAGGTANAAAVYDPPAVPEACMSDVFQASTPYAPPLYPALAEHIVGIVPFKWVKSAGAPDTFTNITPQLAQALWGNGSLPLALFTGNPSDENALVWATGRDADSGTRLTAFAESGVGVFNNIIQYEPTNASGPISRNNSAPMTGQTPFPTNIINGIFYQRGDSGYSSGGDLAYAVGQNNTMSAIGGYYVTYLGLSDAKTAEGLGATDVNYNGVTYSQQALQEGQYSFWGYEHLDYRTDLGSAPGTANEKIVADQIAGQISGNSTVALISGLPLGGMRVSRPIDGGLISNNY